MKRLLVALSALSLLSMSIDAKKKAQKAPCPDAELEEQAAPRRRARRQEKEAAPAQAVQLPEPKRPLQKIKSADQLKKLLKHEGQFVLVISTDYCGACPDVKKGVRLAGDEFPDVAILEVDRDDYADQLKGLEIKTVPTVVYANKGKYMTSRGLLVDKSKEPEKHKKMIKSMEKFPHQGQPLPAA